MRNSKGQFIKGSGFWTGKKRPGFSNSGTFKKRDPRIVGKNNIGWVGNKVGYQGLHAWIRRWCGMAKNGKCKYCGSIKYLQWANKSHLYKRNIKDWFILCAKCHDKYDRKEDWGIATKKFPELKK